MIQGRGWLCHDARLKYQHKTRDTQLQHHEAYKHMERPPGRPAGLYS